MAMSEIELKLLLDEAADARLRASLTASGLDVTDIKKKKLHAIYFDTPDRALSAQRIALRVRKEGRRWVQCVKAGREIIAGLSTPEEVENPAPGGRLNLDAIPDDALRDRVRGAVNGAALAPVCETVIDRTAARIAGPHGGVVELALDAGEIRAGDRVAPLREAELELIAGDPRDIYAVARALFAEGPVRFSRRSKAKRGFDLADGRPAVALTPPVVTSSPLRLDPEMTAEAAAAHVLNDCLGQIAGNVAAAAASDAPEGPHQLRVGLRRLRTAATVFGPALAGPALEAIEAEARTLAGAVGRLRDLDVLADEAIGPMAQADPRLTPLAQALQAPREAARVAVRAQLAAPATSALIFDLGAFVHGRGWLRRADFAQTALLASPVAHTAAEALERRWRKAAKLGARIDDLDVEARHEMRKALKKLRYAVEFFGSLWPAKKVKPFRARLKALQDDFGALQDLAMAEETLAGPDAPAADDPAVQRAVGLALGRWEARAEGDWASARAHWAALAKAKRFWA